MQTVETWRGHINRFAPPNKLSGWAVDLQDPMGGCLQVSIRCRGKIVGTANADGFGPDLLQFGSGHGRFEITCETELPYASILGGEVDCLVEKNGIIYGVLPLDSSIQLFVGMLEATRLISQFSAWDETRLRITLDHVTNLVGGHGVNALRAALTLIKSDQGLLASTASAFNPNLVSGFFLKTGLVSSDQSAMVGRNGHLFLIEGSNNVREIFSRPHGNAASTEIAGRWIDLIKARHARVAALGMRFVQIIIPDNITVARELFDGLMSSPSATLAAFEARAARDLPPSIYLSGLTALANLPYGTAFRKVDTHLTPSGAFAVFAELCAMVGHEIQRNVPFDVPYLTSGDLALRFFGHALYELCHAAREPSFAPGRIVVLEQHPAPGRHGGARQVFKNDMAPIRKKVVTFGNSFFAGHELQGSINYWMSIWFAEYHFCFSADIDDDYLRRETPDIVLTQTIERFMDQVPEI